MRRLAYIIAALLALDGGSRANAGGTAIWPGDGDAATHYLFHLGDPTTSPDPSTAAFRIGDFPQGGTPCILQANGSNAKPTCSSLTGFSASPPLLLTGSTLTLTLTDGTLSVNANALRRSAIGGDLIIPLGSNTGTFRVGAANSVLGRVGGTSGPILDIASTTPGDVFWNNGGTIGWSAYPYSAIPGTPILAAIATSGSANDLIAGTIPTARLPTFTTDVVNAGLAMTIQPNVVTFAKTQTIPALAVVANPTGSTANETTVAASVDNTVFGRFTGALGFVALTAGLVSTISADWPVANVRWYCVDGTVSTPGVGFSDTSELDCGTKALKTLAQLDAILPPGGGDNRKIKITVNQGTYTDPPTFLSKLFGYNNPTVVATGTVATCGATKFAGDLADATCLGAIIATGMNAGGYNPTAGGSGFAIPSQLAGGGSPSFPAEPALPLGYRARFGSATATVGLRNFATTISKVTSSQVESGAVLPASFTTSDVFYIEMPGVNVPNITPNVPILANGGFGLQIAGFNFGTSGNNSIVGGVGANHFAFSIFPAGFIQRAGWLFMSIGYSDPTLGFIQTGSPIAKSFMTCSVCVAMQIDGGYTPLILFQNTNEFDTDFGAVFGGIDAEGVIDTRANNIGGRFTARAVRIIGTATNADGFTAGLVVGDHTNVRLGNIEFSGQGSSPAIKMLNDSTLTSPGGTSSGTTGGSGVGLDLTSAVGARVVMPTIPGVTGSADVKLANGTTISWATLAAAGTYTDTAGNQIIHGTTGTTLAGGALTIPALVGPGHVQVNGAGLTSVDTATYVTAPVPILSVTPPTGTGFPHITSSAWDSTARAVNLGTADVTGLLPVADLSTGSNGQVVTMVSGVPTWQTPAAPGTGTVTSVNGTAGHILCTPSSPNPVCDLVATAVTPGTYTYMTGVVDADGRLTSASSGTAPTVYSGLGPIVVSGSTIDCPTCGTSSGSVTGVFGTAGQIIVTPSSPNPVVSLPNVGPGAVTTGGSGIASFTTDAQGRIVSAVTANYQAALSFPPANEFAISTSAGLTGYSTLTVDPGTHVVAMDALALNGMSPPTNVYLGGAAATNSNRDRVQLFVGGGTLPSTGTTGDSTLVDILPATFGGGTAVSAGVTSGIYSSMRIRGATYSGTGQTITEATSLYIDGHPNLSTVSGQVYALHVAGGMSSLSDVILGGSVNIPLYSFGSGGILGIDGTLAGGLTVTSLSATHTPKYLGEDGVMTDPQSMTVPLVFREQDTTATCSGWLAYLSESGSQYNCTTNNPSTTPIEFPTPFVVKHVRLIVNLTSFLLVGGDTIAIELSRNGTALGSPIFTFTSGSTTGFYDSGEISIAGASHDVWGIEKIGSGGSNPSSMHATITMTLRAN